MDVLYLKHKLTNSQAHSYLILAIPFWEPITVAFFHRRLTMLLPNSEKYLKEGVTFEIIDKVAFAMTDN